jgi:hypothetical protein
MIKSKNLGRDSWVLRVPASQTTASSKILTLKNAAGTDKFTVDIEGDVVCNDITIAGTTTISGAVAYPDGLTAGAAGITAVASSGNIAVNTNKFTVAAASGNTVVAGTLGVTGNVAVNTDKFTVAAASGNTAIAGDVAVATNKFTVAAASGNTVVAGSLQAGAAISGATLATVKGIMTWTSESTNLSPIASKGVGTQNFTLTGVAAGDVVQLIAWSGDFDGANLVFSAYVSAADTITLTMVNNSAGSIDPSAQTFTFLVIDRT